MSGGGFKSNPLQQRTRELQEEAKARLYDVATRVEAPSGDTPPGGVAPAEPPAPRSPRAPATTSYKRRGRSPGESPRRDEGHTIYFEPKLWREWNDFVSRLVAEGHRDASMSMIVRIALRRLTPEDVRTALESVRRL